MLVDLKLLHLVARMPKRIGLARGHWWLRAVRAPPIDQKHCIAVAGSVGQGFRLRATLVGWPRLETMNGAKSVTQCVVGANERIGVSYAVRPRKRRLTLQTSVGTSRKPILTTVFMCQGPTAAHGTMPSKPPPDK